MSVKLGVFGFVTRVYLFQAVQFALEILMLRIGEHCLLRFALNNLLGSMLCGLLNHDCLWLLRLLDLLLEDWLFLFERKHKIFVLPDNIGDLRLALRGKLCVQLVKDVNLALKSLLFYRSQLLLGRELV